MAIKEEAIKKMYPGSVLLSDHIQYFVDKGELIVKDPYYKDIGETFDEKQLSRAKYNIRLGRTYYKNNNFSLMDDNHPILTIEPYELVFVESYEVFKMPENVIAMYDLRISGCLAGLGLQTGLHIDPNYYGRFFSPLFNFSDTPFTFRYKDQLASVQFIYTTPPNKDTKAYGSWQHVFTLTAALMAPRASGLRSLLNDINATREENTQEIQRVRQEMRDARQEMQNVNRIFYMLLSLIITALAAILVPRSISEAVQGAMDWRVAVAIAGAFVITVSIVIWAITRRR